LGTALATTTRSPLDKQTLPAISSGSSTLTFASGVRIGLWSFSGVLTNPAFVVTGGSTDLYPSIGLISSCHFMRKLSAVEDERAGMKTFGGIATDRKSEVLICIACIDRASRHIVHSTSAAKFSLRMAVPN
jgi:hypothetical protein